MNPVPPSLNPSTLLDLKNINTALKLLGDKAPIAEKIALKTKWYEVAAKLLKSSPYLMHGLMTPVIIPEGSLMPLNKKPGQVKA